jgi:uncharacterized membrane protein YkvA (DUF1232 family)
MKFVSIARTLMRYWKMAHDPRTPKAVRYLIYGGIAYTLSPIDLLPDWVPGLGLVDDAAVLPGVIALSMMMIPKEVKEQHDAKEEKEIAESHMEGAKARAEQPKIDAKTEQLKRQANAR